MFAIQSKLNFRVHNMSRVYGTRKGCRLGNGAGHAKPSPLLHSGASVCQLPFIQNPFQESPSSASVVHQDTKTKEKSGSITIKNIQEFSRFHRHLFISSSLYVDLYLIDHNLITPQPTQPLGFPILPTASADPITYLSFPITHASHVLTIHITIKPPSTLTMLPSTTTGGCSERQGSG